MKQIVTLAILSLLTLNNLSFAEHQKTTSYKKKLLSQPHRIEKFLEAEGNLTIRTMKNILKVGGALLCCPLPVKSTREFIIFTFCITFLYSGGKGIWNDLDELKAVCFEKKNKQKNNKSPV